MTTISRLKKPEAEAGKVPAGFGFGASRRDRGGKMVPGIRKTVFGIVTGTLLLGSSGLSAWEVHTPPPVINNLCSNCHAISSLGLHGGSSGGDLSAVMERAAAAGGLDAYLLTKYGVGAEIFFLYPSNYVPQMAVVEGKLFTDDIDRLIAFMQTIPPDPVFMMRPVHWIVIVLAAGAILVVGYRRQRERKGG